MLVRDTEIREICNHLQDDLSRFIFEKRLMYSLTSEYRWIQDIVESAECMKSLRTEIRRSGERFLFGAGHFGRTVVLLAPEVWSGVLDNDPEKQGTTFYGVEIVPPQVLQEHPQAEIYVAVCGDQKRAIRGMVSQLNDMGVSSERIHLLGGIQGALAAGQYFDLPQLPRVKDEVFVDAGSYDGATSRQFVQWAGGQYHHIYAFESNPDSIPKCRRGLQLISAEKTTLFPCGVWKERAELHFSPIGHDTMQVNEAGNLCLPVTSIDEELGDERVTFIKMDVEGAEKEALRGAKRMIMEQRPKLAICVYHWPEDIVEIPRYILSIHPDYRLFLRHYSPFEDETVLYAI